MVCNVSLSREEREGWREDNVIIERTGPVLFFTRMIKRSNQRDTPLKDKKRWMTYELSMCVR
jgi:hypothetical protein